MNELIIMWLEKLGKQFEYYANSKNGLVYSYKLKAIKNAINIIKNLKFEIKSGKDIKNIKGIGEGTIKRIDEILETKKLKEIDETIITGKYYDYINELAKVYGIGTKKANEIFTNYHIKSIEELNKAIQTGTIVLPENILRGLKYVDKIERNIPHEIMNETYIFLVKEAFYVDPNIDVTMCGSYRREKPTSNDIDIILTHSKIINIQDIDKSHILEKYIRHLEKIGFIIEKLTSEKVRTKFMGICKTNDNLIRRIDIRFIPLESYYTALLYFTGSGDFNRRMRSVALSMGYTLNEYHLMDNKKNKLKITSEKDIFDYLNMQYLKPKYRN